MRSCPGLCLPHAVPLAVTFRIFTQCLQVLCHLTRTYIDLHIALVVRHALRRTAPPPASSRLHTSLITMARVPEHRNAPWDFAHAAGVLVYLRRVYLLASKIPTALAVTCLVYACILARALAHTSHTPTARSGFPDSPERNISHSCDAADELSLERCDPAPNCSMIPSVPHTQLDTGPTPTSIKRGAIT